MMLVRSGNIPDQVVPGKLPASRAEALLKASGKKSFDEDPGWDGIDLELAKMPKIPIKTLRAFLKEKRDSGGFFNNSYEEDATRLTNLVPKPDTERAKGPQTAKSRKITDFTRRRPGRGQQLVAVCGVDALSGVQKGCDKQFSTRYFRFNFCAEVLEAAKITPQPVLPSTVAGPVQK